MAQEDTWKRFDKWSPLIPKKGQTVQLQFKEDDEAFETEVLFRGVSKSKRTFTIFVRWPLEPDGVLGLTITPDASVVGMLDRAEGVKPFWQTVPKNCREESRSAKLFFLD